MEKSEDAKRPARRVQQQTLTQQIFLYREFFKQVLAHGPERSSYAASLLTKE